MNSVPAIVTVIGALFGLAGLAGGLTAYFKSRLLDQNLSILERTNKAQDDRIQFLEDQVERQTEDLLDKKNAIAVLTNIVTGHEQLETILSALKSHDDKVTDMDRRLFTELEEVLDVLEAIKERR